MIRTILHSDLNNCFASIEMLYDPSLRGKPIAVCGDVETRHGIVLAKSEQAKAKGVKTAMPVWQALKLCPEMEIVKPHFERYSKYSKLVHDIYYRYTNQIEPFGMDEAWLDVTDSRHLYGTGKEIAESIRESVKSELGLTVSVGVSFTKIFAKLGSDMKKPDAVTVISPATFREQVWPLDAGELFGVGRATKKRLSTYGVQTIGDIANTPPELLQRWLGVSGLKLWQCANGLDASPVCCDGYERDAKSVGHGVTCTADLVSEREASRVMLSLCFGIAQRLRDTAMRAQVVSVSVRDNELNIEQFQTRLSQPTQSYKLICEAAQELFRQKYEWKREVRSITVTVSHLTSTSEPLQLDIFHSSSDKQLKLEDALFNIRAKYGKYSISVASLLDENKLPSHSVNIVHTSPGNVVSRA